MRFVGVQRGNGVQRDSVAIFRVHVCVCVYVGLRVWCAHESRLCWVIFLCATVNAVHGQWDRSSARAISNTIRSICAGSRRPHTPQSALHTAEIGGVLQTSRSFSLEIPGVHKHVCEVGVDAQELQIIYRINVS